MTELRSSEMLLLATLLLVGGFMLFWPLVLVGISWWWWLNGCQSLEKTLKSCLLAPAQALKQLGNGEGTNTTNQTTTWLIIGGSFGYWSMCALWLIVLITHLP